MAQPKLNRREKTVAGFMALAVGLFLADRWLIMPLQCVWVDLNSSIVNMEREIDHDRALIADASQLRKVYEACAVPRRKSAADARGDETTRLLKEIESLARASGVHIHDIKPQSAKAEGTGHAAIYLVVDAGWDPMARFILEMQRSAQLLDIQKATLHRKGEAETQLSGQFVVRSGQDANL